ncbi:MAG: hypothetical protein KAT69_03165 [Candidatus Aminicenantes bacterium]|nr:hypothetical protein [Candidatus Aminicenantes bacterium]
MSLNIGSKVQVWDEVTHQCLGWGIIISVAGKVKDQEDIPFIQLESGKKIWGDRCHYIEEKKAIEIGLNVFKAVHEK